MLFVVADGTFLLRLAASLFGYGGDIGDLNALYTYAQLLRTGESIENKDASYKRDFLLLAY